MRAVSRIALRLFTFNLLVVFVPVTGVLYLDVYEAHLRQAQEASLAQQASLLAAALGDRPVLDAPALTPLFDRLERRGDARFRVFDARGILIGDSARGPQRQAVDAGGPSIEDHPVRQRRLYRVGAWMAQASRRIAGSVAGLWRTPRNLYDTAEPGTPSEVRTALAGRYGAATRPTRGQRSMTLFSAVPVRHDGAVAGVVVASQSTFRILTALYAIRLRVFQIVIASLAAAALLTGIAARTVVRPLTRLRGQASTFARQRGVLPERFAGAERRDEIGALARALGELARRTNDHVRLVQSFGAEVSHELKNPLASIRTAAEMMADSSSAEERRRFLDLMLKDVARLERLVSGLRDVARVEGQIEADQTEPVDLGRLLEEVAMPARNAAAAGVRIELALRPGLTVHASPERLAQVFDNLLANATSFAPPGSSVILEMANADGWVIVTVDDSGPGIPETHLTRVFDRFFSYRPSEARRDHVGLGLAIARQIVESYGGTITAANPPSGGARFTVRLPATAGPPSS